MWGLLLAAGCTNGDSPDGVKDEEVIAVINDQEVTVEKVRLELKSLEKRYRVDHREDLQDHEFLLLKTKAVNELIQNTLFQQAADEIGIFVSGDEFEEAVLKAQDGYQQDTFENFLEIEDISRENWENRLKNNLLIKKLIDRMVNSKVSVSEEEIRDYFEKNKKEFHKGKQMRALHIMVETEEEALRIQKKLKSKGADFSELARTHSLAPEAVNGGDLGYFEEGHMPEELEGIFKLKVGEVSNIILTPYGSHIFKVVDKKQDRQMGFEESRKKIHDKLIAERREKAFHDWLKKLKDKAQIEIKHEILAKIS